MEEVVASHDKLHKDICIIQNIIQWLNGTPLTMPTIYRLSRKGLEDAEKDLADLATKKIRDGFVIGRGTKDNDMCRIFERWWIDHKKKEANKNLARIQHEIMAIRNRVQESNDQIAHLEAEAKKMISFLAQ
ncbi:MAG: hypothetical protein GY706_00595 [Bacteroides sp.]|nr:hypothetical protein [Bacteroides sp.]